MPRKLIPDPFACDECGVAKGDHGWRYTKSVAGHHWIRPPEWKILMRMQARRLARKDGRS